MQERPAQKRWVIPCWVRLMQKEKASSFVRDVCVLVGSVQARSVALLRLAIKIVQVLLAILDGAGI